MTTAREDTTRLVELLRTEHRALGEFLIALSAFDGERRWSELGYASLFDFLRRELRLSAGAAQYRKTAAQLIREYPAVEVALRSGDLCLSSVIEVAKVITPANAAEVLPRFFGKSSRDAAFVAAAIRPVENPPTRDFLVTPVRSAVDQAAADVTDGVFRAPEVTNTGSAPTPGLLPVAPAPAPDRPRVRPLDAERARINMTVSRRLLEKLATARDALSHSHPGASEETILEVGLDLIIDRHRKRRGIGAKPRPRKAAATPASSEAPTPAASTPGAPAGALPPPPRTKRSRHVPAAVARAVWERDRGCCAWKLEDGGVCGSTYKLELDHIEGHALGAGNTVDELRVACRPHQVANMRRLYGDALTDRYVGPGRPPRCSEPVAAWCDARSGSGSRAPPAATVPSLAGPRSRGVSSCDSRCAPRSPRCSGPSRSGPPRRTTASRSSARAGSSSSRRSRASPWPASGCSSRSRASASSTSS